MRLRSHAGLGLALAVALFSDSAVDATCPPVQDVEKRARAAVVMRAMPADTADSIGFYAKDAVVMVSSCVLDWCEVNTPMGQGFVLGSLLVDPPAAPAPAQTRPAPSPPPPRACCRICRTGKACGNSCIARNRTCRVGPGCACDRGQPPEHPPRGRGPDALSEPLFVALRSGPWFRVPLLRMYRSTPSGGGSGFWRLGSSRE